MVVNCRSMTITPIQFSNFHFITRLQEICDVAMIKFTSNVIDGEISHLQSAIRSSRNKQLNDLGMTYK